MTRIKFCGMMKPADIIAANALHPDYIGFVFAPGRKRTVSLEEARQMKALLQPDIQAVGVFVNEDVIAVAKLLNEGTIDIAQLHGDEDEDYIRRLRKLTDKPIWKAFCLKTENPGETIRKAENSSADGILLDSGTGSGQTFEWSYIKDIKRPYLLAGGLSPENVTEAVKALHPYGVDVSSGIETEGQKDTDKMAAFAAVLRKEQIS